jgi:hypothetical protein
MSTLSHKDVDPSFGQPGIEDNAALTGRWHGLWAQSQLFPQAFWESLPSLWVPLFKGIHLTALALLTALLLNAGLSKVYHVSGPQPQKGPAYEGPFSRYVLESLQGWQSTPVGSQSTACGSYSYHWVSLSPQCSHHFSSHFLLPRDRLKNLLEASIMKDHNKLWMSPVPDIYLHSPCCSNWTNPPAFSFDPPFLPFRKEDMASLLVRDDLHLPCHSSIL